MNIPATSSKTSFQPRPSSLQIREIEGGTVAPNVYRRVWRRGGISGLKQGPYRPEITIYKGLAPELCRRGC